MTESITSVLLWGKIRYKLLKTLTRGNLREILAVFRREYVKHQWRAKVDHKFQKLVFNPANHKLVEFHVELWKLA